MREKRGIVRSAVFDNHCSCHTTEFQLVLNDFN